MVKAGYAPISEGQRLNIGDYLEAGYSFLWLQGTDCENIGLRIAQAAREVDELRGGRLIEWTGVVNAAGQAGTKSMSIAAGIVEEEKQTSLVSVLVDLRAKENTILLIHNMRWWMTAMNMQALLDSAIICRQKGSHIILVGPSLSPSGSMDIPPEIKDLLTIIPLKLPNEEKIVETYTRLTEAYASHPNFERPSDDDISAAAKAALGLPLIGAENALALSIAKFNRIDIDTIQLQKEHEIRKSDVLEFIQDKDTLADVGGFADLKAWLRLRRRAFTDEAREYGLPYPRGFLIVGIPGSGKSLSAKAVASELRLPLLRLDFGRVFRSLIGQSEAAIRTALHVAETVAPCVLWIDEIEKGMAGVASSGTLDSGVSARVVSTILTWRSETKKAVVVVATANDVAKIPPEVTRKGRFDEIWSTDLPDEEERVEIWAIHIRKMKRNPQDYNLELLAKKSKDMVGAEIEECVRDAMFMAFDEEREFSDTDLMRAIRNTNPIAKRSEELLEPIRKWAKEQARPVARPKTEKAEVTSIRHIRKPKKEDE